VHFAAVSCGYQKDLILDSGFEQDGDNWSLPKEGRIVKTQAYRGNRSLSFRNVAKENYKVASKKLEVVPGKKIEISAFIKGKNIVNSVRKDEGAAFYVESYDEKGAHIGGHYPKGFTGTFDWQQLKAQYSVPTNAKTVIIGLYLRRGAVGECWFDEVRVSYITEAPTSEVSQPLASTPKTSLKVSSLAKVYIDENGFTVKNGKKIFPLGIFVGPSKYTDDETLRKISAAGFNTVLSYGYGTDNGQGEYLDRAKKHNLNVIYSLKGMYPKKRDGNMDYFLSLSRNLINRWKLHDALLAWYINDELNEAWIPHIKRLYQVVKENDPDHPAYQVLYQENILSKYMDITDVIGMDSYPIGIAENLSQTIRRANLSVNTSLAFRQSAGVPKGVWHVAQIMDWSTYKKMKPTPPSLDEMRNLAYQAIISGAKGLLFYSYFDLMKETGKSAGESPERFRAKRWQDIATMCTELKTIIPVILEGQLVSIRKLGGADIPYAAYRYNNELYVILTNPHYKAGKLELELPTGDVINSTTKSNIRVKTTKNQATFDLPSISSGVFKVRLAR